FKEGNALFLLHGGIIAVPNIRGGGVHGSNWAIQGRRFNKQNAIDDFIASAEYLISEKYTSPEKLAISGASHGALIIGAAITQRPELFKLAIANAGPYDMLRMSKYTVGGVNTNLLEFGSPNSKTDYHNLRSYSPFHNVRKGTKYPNTLLITGANDDRVPPFHTYKFLASLQENGDPSSLYSMYVSNGSGHGGALTIEDYIDLELYKYYFLFNQLNIDFY
ncbi:S9 family peptidase, partial [Fulvivirga sp. RKSG066]|uniref:prolyl oligopeptidase family serine peptidase n=1 Tax=Fulvivirga aurantia TaxID=2529383 RepID=UPI0012BBE930